MDRAGTSPGFKKIFANILDSSADDGDASEKEGNTSNAVTVTSPKKSQPKRDIEETDETSPGIDYIDFLFLINNQFHLFLIQITL